MRRELTGLERLGFWKARTTGASTQEAFNVFREKYVRVYMQVCTFPGTSKTRHLCAWDSKREIEEREAGMKVRKEEEKYKMS